MEINSQAKTTPSIDGNVNLQRKATTTSILRGKGGMFGATTKVLPQSQSIGG